MTVSFTDLRMALLKLGLSHTPVIAHASLKSFGEIIGGAETLLRATLDSVWALVMPAFTYKTMITPGIGPANNGITYGSETDLNRMAEPFAPGMPADRQMGVLAEALRLHPRARRTSHPILSFSGVSAEHYLAYQSTAEPLGVLAALVQADGWALLLGVDHTVNTSIHYAERLAGRRQFVRWALLEDRIQECPGFPGDSAGFGALAANVADGTRSVRVGNALVQAVRLRAVVDAVRSRIRTDPLALLCSRADCARCNAVRESVRVPGPVH